jgi:hypothetical protein
MFMPLWRKLYNTIWFAFFSCVLIPRWIGWPIGLPLHVLFGLILLIAVLVNERSLAALHVPARLKRISKVTIGMVIFQIVIGLAIGTIIRLAPSHSTVLAILRGCHILIALGILSHTSSLATGYDMWEEKEFTAEVMQSTTNSH